MKLRSSMLWMLVLIGVMTSLAQAQAEPRTTQFNGTTFQTGDIVLQQINGELGQLVQNITRSKLDHCGIIVVNPDHSIDVLEAISSVQRTPIQEWIERGTEGRLVVLRPNKKLVEKVEAVILEAERFLGRTYDVKFEMDDEQIYCSELVWKAYLRGAGAKLAEPVTLEELRFLPSLPRILWVTHGEWPFGKTLITPAALSRSKHLDEVFNSFESDTAIGQW